MILWVNNKWPKIPRIDRSTNIILDHATVISNYSLVIFRVPQLNKMCINSIINLDKIYLIYVLYLQKIFIDNLKPGGCWDNLRSNVSYVMWIILQIFNNIIYMKACILRWSLFYVKTEDRIVTIWIQIVEGLFFLHGLPLQLPNTVLQSQGTRRPSLPV